MPDFESLRAGYRADWDRLMIKGGRRDDVDAAARRILSVRRRYETVAAATGVRWFVIGLLHLREADLSFATHLHNGDSLKRRTVQVPAGRPKSPEPPYSWEVSAIDALRYDRLDKVDDWSIERILFEAEKYNGFGPRNHRLPSGYLWAGTNIYRGGKYIGDGRWDGAHWDRQLGVAAVLSRLRELDASIAADIAAGGRSQIRPPSLGDAHASAPKATVAKTALAGSGIALAVASPAAAPSHDVALFVLLPAAVILIIATVLLLMRERGRLGDAASQPIETSETSAEPKE